MSHHLGGHDTPLEYHRMLLADPHRMAAYERALRALVRPGDVVLDLGSGTGVLSMLAARRGASRVHAVESTAVAALSEQLVRDNGLDDIVTVHRADFRDLEPVEPVDLVVSDFMGRFIVDDGMLPAVAASRAWMKPGARFCPDRIRLLLAPVELPLQPVSLFERPLYGLDLTAAVPAALDWCYRGLLGHGALLAEPEDYVSLRPPEVLADFDRDLRFEFLRDGHLRAMAGWFAATLAPGVELDTGPSIETHWGQYLFPVPPVGVRAGDVLRFRLQLTGADDPVWRWSGGVDRDGSSVLSFSQASEQDFTRSVDGAPSSALETGRDTVIEANKAAAEASLHGRWDRAISGYTTATRALTPAEDDLAPRLYENLALAWLNLGDPESAIRDFLRALDGDPASREQSLRYLVVSLARSGRAHDAGRFLTAYREIFGPHPDLDGEASGS